MKANAPEKIYLFENPISGTPDDRWLSKRSGDNDIEYIRKDTFIKKAADWLKEIFSEYENLTDYNPTEDFKSYMKGEEI